MIGILQRVSHAEVVVDGERIAAIEKGLMVLVGVERGDGAPQAARLADRLLGYRVFPDAEGRMNLSLGDIDGGLLLVPQFTLPADTSKGMRPSLSRAAPADEGERLFEILVAHARSKHARVECGQFGTHMAVTLTNDGPVTFTLRVAPGE
ncbi:MAG TPA: D-aminoacyl-tRNA deacylase [Gammaproteobacteria bacterium]|nr:D-aminoacyl-tRNA deacylase [Gammaproteobacteria bacterium]